MALAVEQALDAFERALKHQAVGRADETETVGLGIYIRGRQRGGQREHEQPERGAFPGEGPQPLASLPAQFV